MIIRCETGSNTIWFNTETKKFYRSKKEATSKNTFGIIELNKAMRNMNRYYGTPNNYPKEVVDALTK